jgi:hypothetical protein
LIQSLSVFISLDTNISFMSPSISVSVLTACTRYGINPEYDTERSPLSSVATRSGKSGCTSCAMNPAWVEEALSSVFQFWLL